MPQNTHLPQYTAQNIKELLLSVGASGTVYSMVMPETQKALSSVIDGGDRAQILQEARTEWLAQHGSLDVVLDDGQDFTSYLLGQFDKARNEEYFSIYHEPWDQKQDAMHREYFDKWFDWASPVVSIDKNAFPYRHPTSGASEGISKVMSEYGANTSSGQPVIHVFEGEYEGFAAFADSFKIEVKRHKREDWKNVIKEIGPGEQFWISQPSAIDGMVWNDFSDFVDLLGKSQPSAQIIPDLTYVGNVAREFNIDLNSPNIPCFMISQSKPFGGYYQRIGGVISRAQYPSLFGNKWFKNLQSLKWATEMMNRHGVYDLPRKYRPIQERATALIAKSLGIPNLKPADVMLLGIAKSQTIDSELLKTLYRGTGSEKVIRICLTPAMTSLVAPDLAPETYPKLIKLWQGNEQPAALAPKI